MANNDNITYNRLGLDFGNYPDYGDETAWTNMYDLKPGDLLKSVHTNGVDYTLFMFTHSTSWGEGSDVDPRYFHFIRVGSEQVHAQSATTGMPYIHMVRYDETNA